MRGQLLTRQKKILKLIESHEDGIKISEVAEILGTGIRNLYRDFDVLKRSGFPLYREVHGKFRYWKLADTEKGGHEPHITPTELMALYTAHDLMRVYYGTLFQEDVDSILWKIRSVFPSETLNKLDEIRSEINIDAGYVTTLLELGDLIRDLTHAVQEKKQVNLIYNSVSGDSHTVRKIDPYRVWLMNGSFHLLAFCHLKGAVRAFSVERIQSIKVLTRCYKKRNDFDADAYIQSAFRLAGVDPLDVVLRISKEAANVVLEKVWHPTQQVTTLPNGDVRVTMNVPITSGFVAWILGFGSAAEALEPAALRDRILCEHENAVTNYRKPPANP